MANNPYLPWKIVSRRVSGEYHGFEDGAQEALYQAAHALGEARKTCVAAFIVAIGAMGLCIYSANTSNPPPELLSIVVAGLAFFGAIGLAGAAVALSMVKRQVETAAEAIDRYMS